MIRIILTLIFVSSIAMNALAEEKKKKLYKWVDKQGNVHYSDEPIKGGKEVKIPTLPTVKMKTPKFKPINTDINDQKNDQNQSSSGYQTLELASPTNDGVIRNNASMITLTASIEPALKSGHKLRFILDGRVVPNPNNQLTIEIDEAEYGVHTASVMVLDNNGQQIKSSSEVKFALLHVLNPNKRNNNN